MVDTRRRPTQGEGVPETPARRAVLDAWPLPAIPAPEPADEPLAREGTEDEPITERFPVLPTSGVTAP